MPEPHVEQDAEALPVTIAGIPAQEVALIAHARIGRLCAGCGCLKGTRFPLCTGCRHMVSPHVQRGLYALPGAGFEQAFIKAMAELKVLWPPARAAAGGAQ